MIRSDIICSDVVSYLKYNRKLFVAYMNNVLHILITYFKSNTERYCYSWWEYNFALNIIYKF